MSTSTSINQIDATTSSISSPLAQKWGALAVRGLLGIVFGLIAFFLPGATMLSLVLLFSTYAFVDGILSITAAARALCRDERWGLMVVKGVVDIIAAVAVLWPDITVLAFIFLVASWAIISGGLMIGAAFRVDAEYGRWWLVLAGIVSLFYGGLLTTAPLTGAVALTRSLGAYALVFGVAVLIAATKLRSAA